MEFEFRTQNFYFKKLILDKLFFIRPSVTVFYSNGPCNHHNKDKNKTNQQFVLCESDLLGHKKVWRNYTPTSQRKADFAKVLKSLSNRQNCMSRA